MTPLVHVEHLSIRPVSPRGGPEGQPLVRDIGFAIGVGERVGLIGESGSGKSITTLALIGLLPPSLAASGTVTVAGSPVLGVPDRQLSRLRGRTVAVVFQEPSSALDPLMRVGRQVAEPLHRHRGLRGRALRQAVAGALEEVALGDVNRIVRAFPHELSGGQRQRVAIAMALACNPQLLIADECTTALDVTVQKGILSLIDLVVRARNMALLFVSHDIGVIAEVSQRVLVMRHGEIVEQGPTVDLISAPRHPYTQALVAGARSLERALTLGRIS